jgi:Ca2+-binding EF-hand superfamily protein
MQREPKKTETLEVRLSAESKSAFLSACRANGVSASAVIRTCVDRYIRSASRAPIDRTMELPMLSSHTPRWPRLTTGGIGALLTSAAIALFAVPASATTDPRLAALFEWLDSDRDGSVSLAEFQNSMTHSPPLGAVGMVVTTKVVPSTTETREALFVRLDGNRDGTLSLAEFDANVVVSTVATAAISQADADRDGSLTEGELASYFAVQSSRTGITDRQAAAALLARGIIAERDDEGDGKVALAAFQR